MVADARHAWLLYLAVTFVVTPLAFFVKYRRSPFVVRWPPKDRYGWIEIAYATSLAAYSAWLLLVPPTQPVLPIVGTLIAIAATTIVTASVATLGPNWRVGQDAADPTVTYVRRGVYRVVSHPIYVGLLLLGVGLALLDDVLVRAVWYLGATGLYALIQSDAESRRWGRPGSPE